MKKSYCQIGVGLIDDLSVTFYPYHFVRSILSIPLCPIPFCPYTILSVPFCPLPFCPRTGYRYCALVYRCFRNSCRCTDSENWEKLQTIEAKFPKSVKMIHPARHLKT